MCASNIRPWHRTAEREGFAALPLESYLTSPLPRWRTGMIL
jgi:hypothetical protein